MYDAPAWSPTNGDDGKTLLQLMYAAFGRWSGDHAAAFTVVRSWLAYGWKNTHAGKIFFLRLFATVVIFCFNLNQQRTEAALDFYAAKLGESKPISWVKD